MTTEQYRSGHNEHDWKSCDGDKPSESSNLSCSAKNPKALLSDFSFVPRHNIVCVLLHATSCERKFNIILVKWHK